MVITDVVGWTIGGFTAFGGVFGLVGMLIYHNRKDTDKKHDQTQRDIALQATVQAKALADYQTTHAKELSEYQLKNENRLGECIKKDHLDSIIDRYEVRMDRKFDEMKELIKAWINRHDQ